MRGKAVEGSEEEGGRVGVERRERKGSEKREWREEQKTEREG